MSGKDLIVAFVCALLFWLFDKPLKSLGRKVIEFLSWINKAYSNSIYEDAAKLNKQSVAHLQMNLVIFLLGAVLAITIATSYGEIKHISASIENKPVVTIEKLNQEINSIRPLFIAAYIMSIMMYLAYIIKTVKLDMINLYIVCFEQELDGLRPFIGESKYIQLKSRWALMKTREDWKQINDEIEVFKTANNLKFG